MPHDIQARERILVAANKLFLKKGYEQVTVREIAKEANCSHTSIYVYFEDKRKLLEALAKEPLVSLQESMAGALASTKYGAKEKLIRVSKMFFYFGLSYRNLYQAFLTYEADRVDTQETKWELNEQRLTLFNFLTKAVCGVFPTAGHRKVVDFSRMIYFLLHGMIMTYKDLEERVLSIAKRVFPIVTEAVLYLIKGVEEDETNTSIPSHL
ncbi:TetR/AcrR family transcriptional regulator [Halalkalibacterium halodurans]|jgi:AcrR family transcriptional regulator|uniref:BH1836 protein n=1 Tax=Halalkalibacterium halodurans (strain ATCC BAA-125 / DSM 18197 / FERM 7344 / JCM 9153 / C-125) TaxID=272558 RepID=Q9KBT8_HALH5|nr:TetR/AcrR family transcriptional regulator [Halalkalibacterium halodurans]MDY7222396.1 TetR/AcrR family transcriptional regulator [Halalkalibacterium halodurans]MDY7241617.1 TetR/AcrR family transcriptional regulator [Halalkalibacterium halodurans]MED3645311.1 TetR/AcrR family transcriptional regulator [Halalkalibacterium halodurans]MED4082297.1 TetR/AcrR family transcriptional regulator [Halalkalibacterium halodurans]MED4083552.1 TetR/AcrR family transcriptional regulator [Halalkalibacteri